MFFDYQHFSKYILCMSTMYQWDHRLPTFVRISPSHRFERTRGHVNNDRIIKVNYPCKRPISTKSCPYFTAPARNQTPNEDFSEPEPKADPKKAKSAGPAAKKVWHTLKSMLQCLKFSNKTPIFCCKGPFVVSFIQNFCVRCKVRLFWSMLFVAFARERVWNPRWKEIKIIVNKTGSPEAQQAASRYRRISS